LNKVKIIAVGSKKQRSGPAHRRFLQSRWTKRLALNLLPGFDSTAAAALRPDEFRLQT
jgi:hypothetical protein